MKYIFKEITKGPDRVNVQILSSISDEKIGMPPMSKNPSFKMVDYKLDTYQNRSHSGEAILKIFRFSILSKQPTVINVLCYLKLLGVQ